MLPLLIITQYYVQLLAIMNPFSALPTFLSLTEALSPKEKKEIVKKVFWTILVIMLVFTFLGSIILEAFSISIASLRIGGGIILMVLAIDMLGEMPRTKSVDPRDMAVVPIATPLIVGPGTLTTILLLTSTERNALSMLLLIVAELLAALTTMAVLYFSESMVRVLRVSTVRALGRFMSIIIAAVAIDMIAKGIYAYIESYFPYL
ncbi:MarC family protein [Thermogladius sp. 4427co]|uniref:MarC family protein n=1 Tax=Thermogladius sp. 4427co TaxID=3450718 RepID=UPI003F7AF9F8